MKQKRTTARMRCAVAVGSSLMLLGLLAGCGARAQQPVVTSDPLVTKTAAQEAIEQAVSGGKTYAYRWDAEDLDAAAQRITALEEKAWAAQLADPAQAKSVRQSIEQEVEAMRKLWAREAALDPVVSAQEAANLAGTLMEKMYGLDLAGMPLELVLTKSSEPGTPLVWNIVQRQPEESGAGLDLQLDATTGEVMAVSYQPSENEQQAMAAAEPLPCMKRWDKEGWEEQYYFDETDPSYQPMLEEVLETLRTQLSGSLLTGGAQVTEVTAVPLRDTEDRAAIAQHTFQVRCDDGRTLDCYWTCPYPTYDFDGAPLRAFRPIDKRWLG